jgi:hypothetical protein
MLGSSIRVRPGIFLISKTQAYENNFLLVILSLTVSRFSFIAYLWLKKKNFSFYDEVFY